MQTNYFIISYLNRLNYKDLWTISSKVSSQISNSLAQTEQTKFATTPKLFGRWTYEDLKVADDTLRNYVRIETKKSRVFVPHTAGRYQQKKFKKANCPFIERFVGCLSFKGRNAGKKLQSMKIMRATLEIIHHITGQNPIQVAQVFDR